MSAIQLKQAIYQETDGRYFLSRGASAVKAIWEKKGWIVATAWVCGLTAAKTYAVVFSYACLEGAGRSIKDIVEDAGEDDTFLVRFRPLGDVGGWVALALFATLTIRTLFTRAIKEGEYIRLESICRQWIQDNKDMIEEDPLFYEQMYEKMNGYLDDLSLRCLFPKSLVSRRLIALDICQEAVQPEQDSKLYKDRALQEIFRDVQAKTNAATSSKQYFGRVYDGLKWVKQERGCFSLLVTLVLGVALPIICFLCGAASLFGHWGLGEEIFVHRNALTDVGHFGEWPFNAVEVIGLAFLLHIWCILNVGDFVRTRKIYAEHVNSLKDDDQHLLTRFCDIANVEVLQCTSRCDRFISSDRFEPYEK